MSVLALIMGSVTEVLVAGKNPAAYSVAGPTAAINNHPKAARIIAAAKFPNLKVITILFSCSATATVATLGTAEAVNLGHYELVPVTYTNPMGVVYVPEETVRNTVVADKDRAVVRSIRIAIPPEKIPEALDKKAITDAVLADGKIDLGEGKGSRSITPTAADKIQTGAADGDLGMVKTLLTDHPDLVSSKDAQGLTPLHWAAAKNHKGVAELLLASKAEVSAQDRDGWTPLHLAACQADKDLVLA